MPIRGYNPIKGARGFESLIQVSFGLNGFTLDIQVVAAIGIVPITTVDLATRRVLPLTRGGIAARFVLLLGPLVRPWEFREELLCWFDRSKPRLRVVSAATWDGKASRGRWNKVKLSDFQIKYAKYGRGVRAICALEKGKKLGPSLQWNWWTFSMSSTELPIAWSYRKWS